MAISVRLKDVLPLLAALLLVFFAFSLPPFYEEAEPASAQAESGRVLIIDAGHGGEDGGAVAADGTVYQYSSRYRLSTVKNGSYYSIDQGVEPDFVISDPAHFYDRAWLTGYICQLP